MIRKSKQCWEVGEVVKVGFLTLRVVEKEPTPGDYMPDAYILCGLGDKAHRTYRFIPHNGLERIMDRMDPPKRDARREAHAI